MRKVAITVSFGPTAATSRLALVRRPIAHVVTLFDGISVHLKLYLMPLTGGGRRGAIAGHGGDIAHEAWVLLVRVAPVGRPHRGDGNV